MSNHANEYDADRIAALQWMWGDGYLSPGGPEEVASLLQGIDLTGLDVLDIGSGLGAIDILLAEAYGVASVVGIDVEEPLVADSIKRVEGSSVADRVRFQLVEPGPLEFADGAFDVVFSKDAIIHIPDKLALCKDVFRVLRPGGIFVGSDWLRGGDGGFSQPTLDWLDIIGLTFEMNNSEQTESTLRQAGFQEVSLTDRNQWYLEEIDGELEMLSGDNYPRLVERIGEEKAAERVRSSAAKKTVVEIGELRPTHFRGRKPG